MRFLNQLTVTAVLGCGMITLAGAQSLPREAFKAKTIYVVNKTGKPAVENGADSELTRWSRFTMADDADSADIRIVLTKAGSTTIDKETPNAGGTGMESSSSTSFSFGIDMHAYVKGQQLYFYQTNSNSSGEKGGRNVIDNFRKLFPKNE